MAQALKGGTGVERDQTKSAQWLKKGAEQNDADCQFMLGLAFEEGDGVIKDYAEAVKWYKRAADQGQTSGQYALGVQYVSGNGVDKDLTLAYMWFNLASTTGSSNGKVARAELEKNMTRKQIADAQRMAREWKPTKVDDK